jgi:hypothetical protein
MRALSSLRGYLKVLVWAVCFVALAATGGESLRGSAPWLVGDLVVCVGSGQCRIYPTGGGTPTSIAVPDNPKKDTGGAAWSSAFDLYVVDAWNKQVLKFSKTDPHTVNQTLDTEAAYSPGVPGPLLVDSAGNVYVGMKNAGVILKYDRNGLFPSQIDVATENGGGVDWMDLADDHKTLWYTSSGRTLQRVDLTDPDNTYTSIGLTGTGPNAIASGLRILFVPPPSTPGVVPDVDGSSGVLVADGNDIRIIGGTAKTFDAAGEDAWRAVTLHPDGRKFLAATAAGKIYTFELTAGNGPGGYVPPTGDVIDTGSTGISSLTVKGGLQLNVRPVNFTNTTSAVSDVQRLAVFGNPAAGAGDPFPRHILGIWIPSLPALSDFPIVVSANWVLGDGACSNPTDLSDYDCRASSFNPLPRCIPYVSSSQTDCVFYRLEDELLTIPEALAASLIKFIDFHLPANGYLPAACTVGDPLNLALRKKGNPRMLRDPDPVGGDFTQDITIGITQTATDPIFGSGTGGTRGSDYAAFDRCLGENGGAIAQILKPLTNANIKSNSSVPFDVSITRDGMDVGNAVTPPNNMSLFVRHNGTGVTFLEPQPTPGSSPNFFTAVTVKVNKNTTRTAYRANWDTTGKPTGSYTGCVSSIAQPDPVTNEIGDVAGLFAPVCVTFNIR